MNLGESEVFENISHVVERIPFPPPFPLVLEKRSRVPLKRALLNSPLKLTREVVGLGCWLHFRVPKSQ